MTTTYKLIYTSQAKEDICYRDIDEILKKSRKNNDFFDVSGILIFSDGYFIQLLEAATAEIVRATLARIIKDPRHHTVRIIREWTCAERSLKQSSMAFMDHDLQEGSQQFIQKLFSDSMMVQYPTNHEFVNFFKGFDLAATSLR